MPASPPAGDPRCLERARQDWRLGFLGPASTRRRIEPSSARVRVRVRVRTGRDPRTPQHICESRKGQETTARPGPVTARSAAAAKPGVVQPLRHYCRSRAHSARPDNLLQLRQVVRVWFRKIGRPACIAVPSLRAPSSAHPYPSSLAHIYAAGTRCRTRSNPTGARFQMPCLTTTMSPTTR